MGGRLEYGNGRQGGGCLVIFVVRCGAHSQARSEVAAYGRDVGVARVGSAGRRLLGRGVVQDLSWEPRVACDCILSWGRGAWHRSSGGGAGSRRPGRRLGGADSTPQRICTCVNVCNRAAAERAAVPHTPAMRVMLGDDWWEWSVRGGVGGNKTHEPRLGARRGCGAGGAYSPTSGGRASDVVATGRGQWDGVECGRRIVGHGWQGGLLRGLCVLCRWQRNHMYDTKRRNHAHKEHARATRKGKKHTGNCSQLDMSLEQLRQALRQSTGVAIDFLVEVDPQPPPVFKEHLDEHRNNMRRCHAAVRAHGDRAPSTHAIKVEPETAMDRTNIAVY